MQGVHSLLQTALAARMSEATERNANSSRSHAFFIIKILIVQDAGAPHPIEPDP
jgi:hypothetical protein